MSGSLTLQRARSASAPRPGTPKATCSATNGRSTIPGCDREAARSGWPFLEAPHLGFGLGSPELLERARRLLGRAKLAAQIAPNLRHAQNRFGRDIALIGHERCDHVD